MKKVFYFAALAAITVLDACHKKSIDPNSPDAPGTTVDKIKDSIYLYTKEAYYWHDAIPDYATFAPRSVSGTTDAASYTGEVNLLSQYALNPNNNNLPYEYVANSGGAAKYSFIDGGQTSTALGGSKADFGFAITAITNTDFRVRYVYATSAAGNANMHRGEQIVTINSRSNLDISVSADYDFIKTALSTSPMNMTLKKADGTTYSVSLTSAAYTVNPVIATKTFTLTNGKIVGYMVFNSFTSPANAQTKLDAAFASFASAGVTDLVVDLRYNGGGYVSTAEYLSNLIVPTAKNGTLMYNTYFNNTLASGQEQVLKNMYAKDANGTLYNYGQIDYSVAGNAVNFSKKGTLNISRVFFIVTSSTASASELTINNLRSQMDVKLIGRTSYGKPVGFFAININAYQLYVPEFETKNSANQGGYYTGMNPGSTDFPGYNDADDLTHDFGDANETLLAHALNFVGTGLYTKSSDLHIQSTGSNATIIQPIGAEGFSGMVMDKQLKHK